jgi:hypothetical protein
MQTEPYAMCFCGSGWKSAVPAPRHSCFRQTHADIPPTVLLSHPRTTRLTIPTERLERKVPASTEQPSNPFCLHNPCFYFSRWRESKSGAKRVTAASPEVRLQRTTQRQVKSVQGCPVGTIILIVRRRPLPFFVPSHKCKRTRS